MALKQKNIFFIKQMLKRLCLVFFLFLFQISNAGAQNASNQYLLTIPLDNHDYKIEYSDNLNIKISFNKPLLKNIHDYTKLLPRVIKSQEISADKTKIEFQTQGPATFQTYSKNNTLSIRIKMSREKAHTRDDIVLTAEEFQNSYRVYVKYNYLPMYSIKAQEGRTTLYFFNKISLNVEGIKKFKFYQKTTNVANTIGGRTISFPGNLLDKKENEDSLVIDITKENDVSDYPEEDFISSPEILPQIQTENITSLSFPWNTPTNIGVFQRGPYLWVVFDQRQNIDENKLYQDASSVSEEVLVIPHTQATVIRFKLKPNVKAGLRKEGLLWILDLSATDVKENIKDMSILTQYDTLRNSYFYIPTTNAGKVISVIDPDIGDNLFVATISELQRGLNSSYSYPDFKLLRSLNGLAVVPKNSKLRMERGNTGIIIRNENRSLNISEDLDIKKFQQAMSEQELHGNKFLIVPQENLWSLPYNEAVSRLKDEVKSLEGVKKRNAQLELCRYYISRRLGSNALKVLREISQEPDYVPSEETEALRGVANILMHRYDQAMENLAFGQLVDNNEAVFWRTLASAAKEYRKENNIILVSYASLVKDYPSALKAAIALIAADNAIKSGDDLSAQNFIDVLNTLRAENLYQQAQLEYLVAQRRVLQGYPQNALRLYEHLGTSSAEKYSAFARFEATTLKQKLGRISLAEASKNLEQLNYAWKENSFTLNLLKTLADYYSRQGDYLNALRKYNLSLKRETPEQQKQTLQQMLQLLEDIFLNNRADNLSPVKILSIFQEFEWLLPQSSYYNHIVQKVADRMVEIDLLPRAYTLLNNLLKYGNLSAEERSKVGTRLAIISLFDDHDIEALNYLDQTYNPNDNELLKSQRKIVRAKILSNLGRDEDAIDLLDDDYSKNALLLKSEIYWNAGKWNEASDTIRYLIETPKEGEKLSQEQIGYILDWATALRKSGKNTVLVRVRNKFLPYFENTKYYSSFSLLTSTMDNDKIDLKEINQMINEVTAFSNFTKLYNQALKDNKVD